LPKGYIENGEELAGAAVRKVSEASGHLKLWVIKDFGVLQKGFDHDGRHIIHQEHFFLMELNDDVKTNQ